MKRLARIVAAGAVVALALTGCTDAGSSGGTDTLVVNMAFGRGVVTENFNPFSSTGTEGTRGYVFESLMGVNVLKGGSLTPWLATAEKLSSDGRTLTLTLDPRATWNDGSKLTADDVVFTFGLLKKYPALNDSGITFSTVTAKDPHTVVFTFAAPAVTQVGAIVQQYIVPAKYWQGQDPTKWTNPHPVGSGPYKEEKLTSQQVTLVARTDYWRQKDIAVKHIRFPIVSANSSTEVSNLDNGTEDMSGGAIPNVVTQFVNHDKAHNHIFYPTYGANFLFFNLDRPALANVHVRQAVSLAIDKDELIKLVTQVGAYPVSPTGLDQKTQSSWLDPAYTKPVATDLAAAKQQLALAGYQQKGGKAVNAGGSQLAFTIIEVADFADSVQRDRIIATQLAAIGIKVTVKPEASGTYTQDKTNGDFDVITGGYAYGATPWDMYNSLLNSSYAGKKGGTASYDNYGRFRDAGTDATLAAFASATGTAQQVALSKQLEKTVVDQVPFVPLSSITAGCAYTTRNWVGWPSDSDPYAICSPWIGSPMNTQVVLNLKPAKR